MELFGISCCTLWPILKTVFWIWVISVLYDWLQIFAWRRKYKIKGDFPLPLVGNMLNIIFRKWDEIDVRAREKYGAVSGGNLGFMKTLQVSDIDLLKKIFIKDHVQFQNRLSIDFAEPWPMNYTLLALKDEQWKRVRNIVTPTFSASKLKKMIQEINYCAGLLTSGLTEAAKSGDIVDSRKHFGCYTMDVIASTGFGIHTDSYSNPDDPFVSLAQKVFGTSSVNPLVLLAMMMPNLFKIIIKVFGLSVFYPKDSLAFFVDVIKKVIKERQEKGDTERTDLLQLMMNAELQGETADETQTNKKLSLDELLGQGIIAFVAGYETTASLLTFVSYVLATHPDIQDKLIKEIDEHITTDLIEYSVVMEMPYLDQVICETLRMYPPVHKLNRTTSKHEDVQVDGYWFPRDTGIMYSIYQFHHNLGYFPEPEKFIPERFTAEEKAKRDPFAFMPFGHGPRNCIGMRLALLESKIAVVAVLRKLKFVRCDETEEPLELVKESFIRPKNLIKVAVELR